MSATLAAVATALETAAGAGTSANPNEAGYYKRIAAAAESLAGASTTANENPMGYMKRAAVALESIAGTSGAEENTNESGYKKRIVDALEVQAGAVEVGSLDRRMLLGAQNAEFGSEPTQFIQDSNVETGVPWVASTPSGTATATVTTDAPGKLAFVGGSANSTAFIIQTLTGIVSGESYLFEAGIADYGAAGSAVAISVGGGTEVIHNTNTPFSNTLIAGALNQDIRFRNTMTNNTRIISVVGPITLTGPL
jgi:hypothetical protein